MEGASVLFSLFLYLSGIVVIIGITMVIIGLLYGYHQKSSFMNQITKTGLWIFISPLLFILLCYLAFESLKIIKLIFSYVQGKTQFK